MKTEAEALAAAKGMKGKVTIWFHEGRRSYVVRAWKWPRPKDPKWKEVNLMNASRVGNR